MLDLTGYFRTPHSLRGGCWAAPPSPSCQDTSLAQHLFLLRWQGGPLALLRLNAGVYTGGRMGPLQLVAQYLKLHLYHQVLPSPASPPAQVLLFLSQLSWTHSGHILILCLATAFNAFIKLPYTKEKVSGGRKPTLTLTGVPPGDVLGSLPHTLPAHHRGGAGGAWRGSQGPHQKVSLALTPGALTPAFLHTDSSTTSSATTSWSKASSWRWTSMTTTCSWTPTTRRSGEGCRTWLTLLSSRLRLLITGQSLILIIGRT